MLRTALLVSALVMASDTHSVKISDDSVTFDERVSLKYHPSDFIESTGGLIVRQGALGFRVIGPDGQNGLILSTSNYEARLSAETGIWGPRDLVLHTGRDLVLEGVPTEIIDGTSYARVVINGEDALVPYFPVQ